MASDVFNRNISNKLHNRLHELADEGIRCFAFTPDGGWAILTNSNRHVAYGIPNDCHEKLKELKREGHQIHWVSFAPKSNNSWSIITDRTFYNVNVPSACHNEMVKVGRGRINKVIFHPVDPNCWVIFHEDDFIANNIPSEAFKKMREYNSTPRQVHHFTFTAKGWLILANDDFNAKRIDPELYEQLRPLRAKNRHIDLVVFDPDGNGWSCIIGKQTPMRQVEEDLGNGTSLWDEMESSMVPGVSIAVVENNSLSWAKGYGHLREDNPRRIRPDTIFQAASVSKPIAAIGLLRLVQAGILNLDDKVSAHLKNWDIPLANNTTITNETTLRQLLSHCGGTNRERTNRNGTSTSGYGGYDSSVSTLPTTEQILNGTSPANSDAVQVVYDPGTSAQYSGAGYTVCEKAMSDADDASFADLMRNRVLEPLNMNDSFFGPEVPANMEDQVASAHTGVSGRVSGGRNRYPELAAAGLYSTVLDLVEIIKMMNQGGRSGNGEAFLGTNKEGKNYVRDEILKHQHEFLVNNDDMGLGFRLVNVGENCQTSWPTNFYYHHGGSNRGFKSYLRGYPVQGAGVVVMTNGNISSFTRDIANAVARVMKW